MRRALAWLTVFAVACGPRANRRPPLSNVGGDDRAWLRDYDRCAEHGYVAVCVGWSTCWCSPPSPR